VVRVSEYFKDSQSGNIANIFDSDSSLYSQ